MIPDRIPLTRNMVRVLNNTALMLEERGEPRMCNTCIADYMALTTEPKVAETTQRVLLAWVNSLSVEQYKNLRAWCMAPTTTTNEVVRLTRLLASTIIRNLDAANILQETAKAVAFHQSPHLLVTFLNMGSHNSGYTYPLRNAEELLTHWVAWKGDETVLGGLHAWANQPWRTADEVVYALEACAQELSSI